jgi:hypothetical protein
MAKVRSEPRIFVSVTDRHAVRIQILISETTLKIKISKYSASIRIESVYSQNTRLQTVLQTVDNIWYKIAVTSLKFRKWMKDSVFHTDNLLCSPKSC